MKRKKQEEVTLLIVPGYGDSGPGHWQTLWEKQFPHVARIVQDSWENVNHLEWLAAFDRLVELIPASLLVVAHSLGCALVVEWANQKRPTLSKIKGALLVAPADPTAKAFRALHISGFDRLILKKLPFPSILVASSNDPFMTLQVSWQYADSLGSEFVNIGDKGHINADSQLGSWEEGKSLVRRLM